MVNVISHDIEAVTFTYHSEIKYQCIQLQICNMTRLRFMLN